MATQEIFHLLLAAYLQEDPRRMCRGDPFPANQDKCPFTICRRKELLDVLELPTNFFIFPSPVTSSSAHIVNLQAPQLVTTKILTTKADFARIKI